VNSYRDWFAAKVYKCFLRGACRVVRANRGTITAFDGDRIMAVYLGENQSTDAAGPALEINHVVTEMINPMIRAKHSDVKTTFRYAVGIDRSTLFVARTGVRGSNDLVWVGRAANYAAKMATIRDDAFATWITTDVYENMKDSIKFSKGTKESAPMWEKRRWTVREADLYGSNWRRSP